MYWSHSLIKRRDVARAVDAVDFHIIAWFDRLQISDASNGIKTKDSVTAEYVSIIVKISDGMPNEYLLPCAQRGVGAAKW